MKPCPHCGCPLEVVDGNIQEYVEPVKEPVRWYELKWVCWLVLIVLGVAGYVDHPMLTKPWWWIVALVCVAILARCG